MARCPAPLQRRKERRCPVDSHYTHLAWRRTEVGNGGIGKIRYPLVSDLKKNIARDYGILFDDEVALRGLFLIDREGVVRHALVNDLPLGRNVDEALRILDALRFHEKHGDVCPANWKLGEEGMKPTSQGVVDSFPSTRRSNPGSLRMTKSAAVKQRPSRRLV